MTATKQMFLASVLLASTGLLSSCSDNDWADVDGASPVMELTSEHIMTDAGKTIKIAGTLTDADGIATIDIVCHELNLNKTIDLIDIYGEPQTSYNLNYAFAIQGSETGDNFVIEVTTTDVGGRKTTREVLVTMDADFDAPVFTAAPDKEITVLIKEQTLFNLKFTVEDNRVIDYVTVDIEGVDGFPMTVQGNGNATVEFAQKLSLPAKEASYNVTITAYDKAAQDGEVRSTVVNSVVNVSELPDFEKMYLADVATAAELNSDVFGVPMLVDHVGAFQYQARYYNEKAGTEICFIPQKTDFSPICFGPDPENTSVLGDDPETVGRITLSQAGVYYLINFNTKTGAYSTSTYSISDAIDPVMHLHYGDNDLDTWWNHAGDEWWQEFYFGPMTSSPTDVMRMSQDSKNSHIYIYEGWSLTAGETLKFAIHNWHSHGWWNFATWRCDDSAEPEKFMYYGNYFPETSHYQSNDDYFQYKYGSNSSFDLSKWGDEAYRKNFVPDNWCKVEITTSGTYNLIFDAHLERAKLVRAN
jgi:hypothetical protein